MSSHHSIFPLDQNRKLISQTMDKDGYIHKILRLYSPNDPNDTIDIEVVEKFPVKEDKTPTNPKKEHIVPDVKRKIIEEEITPDGYIHKIVMVEEQGGGAKEYYVDEKLPERK